MNDSLKLSYDLLFENGSGLNGDQPDSRDESQPISLEEMQRRLQENDARWQNRLQKEKEYTEQISFEKGITEGKKQAKSRYLEQLSGFEQVMNQIDNKYNQAIEELKPQIAALVFDMTEKVLDIPLKHKKLRGRVQKEVSQIIEELDDKLQVKVKLSESDFNMLQKAFEKNEEIEHIHLQIDESFNPGEYAVETKNECIIKNFKKIINDFKESITFTDIESL